MKRTSNRKPQIVAFIQQYTLEQGRPPTRTDVARAMGTKVSWVRFVLVELRVAGIVDWQDGKPRTLRVIPKSERVSSLQELLGNIAKWR